MNAEHEKSCFFKEIYLFPCQNCNKKLTFTTKKIFVFFSCNFDTKFFIFFFINQILIDCMIFPIQLSLIWYITYKVYFANLSQNWNLMSTAVECSSHQKILWSRPHEMAGPKRVNHRNPRLWHQYVMHDAIFCMINPKHFL